MSIPICEPTKVQKIRKQTMNTGNSLNHTTWKYKYHIVWKSKYRKKNIYKGFKKFTWEYFKKFGASKECKAKVGHLMPDHVHILISIPPKYSVS